jgi:hypothetical protein
MDKQSLVVLKENNGGFENVSCEFKPHVPYRCIKDGDKGYIVFGEYFSNKMFAQLFDFTYDRFMSDFAKIGLIVDGKPVNKTTFLAMAFNEKYGNRGNSFHTYWFWTHPKECMYRFSPNFSGDSKAVSNTNIYNSFIDLVNGNMEEVDNENIEFGNGGIPFSYGPLKKRFIYTEKHLLF